MNKLDINDPLSCHMLSEEGTLGFEGAWIMTALKGHVLIIEDEPIIAIEVEGLLSDLGYETFDLVDSPQGALAAALAHRPDLVTADYRINGGTGVEAVAEIERAIGRVPVIYVTGNAEIISGQSWAPVVDKPISLRALAEACRSACGA
jgi:CheY-like chemotaxis protein